ncbi:MAG: hypothetical protein ABFC80_02620 [Coriobacteriales bacterium]
MRPQHLVHADGGAVELTVVVPFTRIWAVEAFFGALYASDVVPERSGILAYVDSDDDALVEAVRDRIGDRWRTTVIHVSGWAPPADKERATVRRKRHTAMRLALRGLVPKTGMLFLSEDDTLVCPDVIARLSAALEGADIATGVQVGRWGPAGRVYGLWRLETSQGAVTVQSLPTGKGCEYVSASGLYAMLCSAETYRRLDFRTWHDELGQDVSVTWAFTRSGGRLAVDWACGCGHLTPQEVIAPETPLTTTRRYAMPLTIMTPSGPFWPSEPRKEPAMKRGTYRTKQRVVIDGRIVAGKGTDIPVSQAIEWARQGYIHDPVLGRPGVETPVAAVDETQALEPVMPDLGLAQYAVKPSPAIEVKEDDLPLDSEGRYVCSCGKTYKTREGLLKHKADKGH